MTAPRVVGVLPDVAALDRVFDYLVPESMDADVRVGSVVRIPLHGRRVRGWVVSEGAQAPEGVTLRDIAKVTGWGPPPDLVELAGWAAWRWAGRRTAFLGTATATKAIRLLPSRPEPQPPAHPAVSDPLVADALAGGCAVVRLPPASDVFPFVAEAAARGPGLVIAPTAAAANAIARRLVRQGTPVALQPDGWAEARAGGRVVVGTRAAAWAPVPDLAFAVVVDCHDSALQEERTPTWHARDVVAERAARAGAPCVLVSPTPDLATLACGRLVTPSRQYERAGWPVLDIVDLRREDPSTGLLTDKLVALARDRRVICVLNRKGRARLLACAACRELARCETCGAAVAQDDADLVCRTCATSRPAVCGSCGAQRLRTLRPGVTKLRSELETVSGVAVGEVTAESEALPNAPVLVGTEAVLHRVTQADVVAFLDFDQELLATRVTAGEDALALLALAGRLVGGRRGSGRVVVQTRVPDHEVLDAALHGDPRRFSAPEWARRSLLGFPPASAVASVSGPAAEDYVAAVRALEPSLDVPAPEIVGPDADGRYLLRAADHQKLCDALAAVERPKGRLRLSVDPKL